MNQKVSLWALFGVAAIALMLMALIGNSDATGDMIGARQPRAIPAPTPPLRPILVDRPDNVVMGSTNDNAAISAMAERMEKIDKHTCYLINMQLDRDAGRATPPELISKTCPTWS